MSRAALIVGGLAVGALAVYLSRQNQEIVAVFDDAGAAIGQAAESAAEFLTEGFGFMKIANMKNVSPNILENGNIQAMLRVIRSGEGTADAGGYKRLFGGGSFASFADHPRITVRSSGYTSTAAGAYQMLATTWDETRRLMNLPDFSPASQDLAAVGRIAARNALNDVLAGRFETAIGKINREWASLPGSPYGQPVVTMDRARSVFLAYGGQQSTEVV